MLDIPVLEFDPLLSKEFFSAAADIDNNDYEVSFTLPPDALTFRAFMEDPEDGRRYKDGVRKLCDELQEWGKANGQTEEAIEQIDEFYYNCFTPEGMAEKQNGYGGINFPLYSQGIPALAGLIKKLKSDDISLDKRKTTFTNLCPGLVVCPPGCNTNIYNSYMSLSGNVELQLMEKRTAMINQIGQELIEEDRDESAFHPGNDTHYVVSISNLYYEQCGVKYLRDQYSVELKDHDADRFPLSRIAIYKFPSKITTALTAEYVIQSICTDINEDVMQILRAVTPENYKTLSEDLATVLDKFGGDGSFNPQNFLNLDPEALENYEIKFLENGNIKSNKIIEHIIFDTIMARLGKNKYLNLEVMIKFELEPNKFLYALPGANSSLAHAYIIDEYGARTPLAACIDQIDIKKLLPLIKNAKSIVELLAIMDQKMSAKFLSGESLAAIEKFLQDNDETVQICEEIIVSSIPPEQKMDLLKLFNFTALGEKISTTEFFKLLENAPANVRNDYFKLKLSEEEISQTVRELIIKLTKLQFTDMLESLGGTDFLKDNFRKPEMIVLLFSKLYMPERADVLNKIGLDFIKNNDTDNRIITILIECVSRDEVQGILNEMGGIQFIRDNINDENLIKAIIGNSYKEDVLKICDGIDPSLWRAIFIETTLEMISRLPPDFKLKRLDTIITNEYIEEKVKNVDALKTILKAYSAISPAALSKKLGELSQDFITSTLSTPTAVYTLLEFIADNGGNTSQVAYIQLKILQKFPISYFKQNLTTCLQIIEQWPATDILTYLSSVDVKTLFDMDPINKGALVYAIRTAFQDPAVMIDFFKTMGNDLYDHLYDSEYPIFNSLSTFKRDDEMNLNFIKNFGVEAIKEKLDSTSIVYLYFNLRADQRNDFMPLADLRQYVTNEETLYQVYREMYSPDSIMNFQNFMQGISKDSLNLIIKNTTPDNLVNLLPILFSLKEDDVRLIDINALRDKVTSLQVFSDIFVALPDNLKAQFFVNMGVDYLKQLDIQYLKEKLPPEVFMDIAILLASKLDLSSNPELLNVVFADEVPPILKKALIKNVSDFNKNVILETLGSTKFNQIFTGYRTELLDMIVNMRPYSSNNTFIKTLYLSGQFGFGSDLTDFIKRFNSEDRFDIGNIIGFRDIEPSFKSVEERQEYYNLFPIDRNGDIDVQLSGLNAVLLRMNTPEERAQFCDSIDLKLAAYTFIEDVNEGYAKIIPDMKEILDLLPPSYADKLMTGFGGYEFLRQASSLASTEDLLNILPQESKKHFCLENISTLISNIEVIITAHTQTNHSESSNFKFLLNDIIIKLKETQTSEYNIRDLNKLPEVSPLQTFQEVIESLEDLYLKEQQAWCKGFMGNTKSPLEYVEFYSKEDKKDDYRASVINLLAEVYQKSPHLLLGNEQEKKLMKLFAHVGVVAVPEEDQRNIQAPR